MLLKKIIHMMQFVYILPSSTGEGLHISWETNIIKNAFPIQWISEIAERILACISRKIARRKNNCFRNRNTDFYCKAVIKKFFISTPPERIIDNGCSANCRILQISPVERYIL